MLELAFAAALAGEIVLSECSRFPEIDPRAVRYQNNGPSMYGVWHYELVYRQVRSVLLTNPWGQVQCEQPVERSQIATQRFSLNEQFGGPERVVADARAWLASRVMERCD